MPEFNLADFEQLLSRARQLEKRVVDLQSTVARLRDEFDAMVAAREPADEELVVSN
jgi:hypothetical protein